MTRWRTRHRGTPSDRGAAAVEFAIVFVVLIAIIFAIIEFGRLFFTVQAMKSASREGARTAVVHRDYNTAALDAAQAGKALSGDPNQQARCRVFQSASGSFPDLTQDANWTLGSQSGGTVINCAAVPSDPCDGATAVAVRVWVTFQWWTPLGRLPGFSSANLTNALDVAQQTAMRCEPTPTAP